MPNKQDTTDLTTPDIDFLMPRNLEQLTENLRHNFDQSNVEIGRNKF